MTRGKKDDHNLFDAAETEAMALVQQHRATYMSNGQDVKKEYLASNVSNLQRDICLSQTLTLD